MCLLALLRDLVCLYRLNVHLIGLYSFLLLLWTRVCSLREHKETVPFFSSQRLWFLYSCLLSYCLLIFLLSLLLFLFLFFYFWGALRAMHILGWWYRFLSDVIGQWELNTRWHCCQRVVCIWHYHEELKECSWSSVNDDLELLIF